MKIKSLKIFGVLLLLLTACNNKSGSKEDIHVEETPDGYVDVTPTNTEDGEILHCFNWSFKQIEKNLVAIKDAGFKSIQTSPVQQPKSSGSAWWAFYQPLSFSIADNSPLGTKQDLKDLCDAAEELGISVICDIVFNHLANIGDGVYEADGVPKVNPEVEKYEPEIYAARNDSTNPTFHHEKPQSGSGSETQYYAFGDLPDLNTSHPLVQQRSLALLKECIDVGVDGFRFDAAKHIETPDDPDHASDFWPNTLGVAKEYYKTKTGKDLFAVGEVLGSPKGRDCSVYTKLMNISDDGFGGGIYRNILTRNPDALLKGKMGKDGIDASKFVSWIESHDDYTGSKDHLAEARIIKSWAAMVARKGGRSLYLARPDESVTVAKIGSYTFENPTIAAANRFHNRFLNAEEKPIGAETYYGVQRFDDKSAGAVLVCLENNVTEISVEGLDKLKNGIYYDQITGRQVKVINGKADIETDKTGVAVLTMSKNELRPIINLSHRDTSFGGSLSIKLSVKNATEMSYQINGGAAVTFKDTTTITLNETATIKYKASNSQFSVEKEYTYKKYDLIPGYFNVVNINPDHFEQYNVYLWSWGGRYNNGLWNQDYQMEDGVMLVDTTGITGFLIGLFEKDYTISELDKWDSNVVKQSKDIKGDTLESRLYDAGEL